MKKFFLCITGLLLGLLLGAGIQVEAEENRSTEFEHLEIFHYSGNFTVYDEETHDNTLTRASWNQWSDVTLMDEKEHIYCAMPHFIGYQGTYIILTGKLESDTARIVSVSDSIDDFDGSSLLAVDIDTSVGYYHLEKEGEVQIDTEGSVFTTSPGSLLTETPAKVLYVTVQDGELSTVHKILLDEVNPASSSIQYRSSEITLYDGTEGKSEKLEGFSEIFNEEKNSCIYGVNTEISTEPNGSFGTRDYVSSVSLGDKEKYSVPDGVESIRIQRVSDEEMPEGGDAFCPDMEVYYTDGKNALHRDSYYYYRQRTYCVKMNDGEWIELDDGAISPELPLKEGWNILTVQSMSDDWMKSNERIRSACSGSVDKKSAFTKIFLIYKESSSEYTLAAESENTGIDSIEVYKALDNITDAKFQFCQYEVYEKDGTSGEKWVDLYSSSPCVWMKVFREEQSSTVDISDSERIHGGFYMELNPETQKEISIVVTAQNGESRTELLHINWIESDVQLQRLYPSQGGSFTQDYDRETQYYYLKKDDSDTITLNYQGSPNTTLDIYVERKKEESVSDADLHSINIASSVHNVQFKITAPNGDTNTYTVAIERTDTGIGNETRNRAKKMIDKMVSGGYLEEIRNSQPVDSYWGTFRAASLGEDYLEGTLAGDVTSYNYTQATSYAAVILQLVMSGENPYNYLGVNYVEALANMGPGYYGPYANNIWTLLALDAAGYPLDSILLDTVLSQACDTGFDLDMRGWAFAALSNHLNEEGVKEKLGMAVETIKEVQLAEATEVNGYEVTGAFENFYYTNRNINSHACVVSGLTSLGVDVGTEEWQVEGLHGLVDGISLLEEYQQDDGTFLRSPSEGRVGYNKDAVIAVGDLYNGANVWQRYALTNDRFNELLDEAERLLESDNTDEELKTVLADAYCEAAQYRTEEQGVSEHGEEYYALQEAVYAINGEKPDVFQGTAEERTQVRDIIAVIDTLPEADSVAYKDRDVVLKAQEAYEALNGDERLEHYVTNYRVLAKEYDYIHQIDVFLDAVKEIEEVDLSKAARVQEARDAYNALNDRQREEEAVKERLEILLKAEETIEAIKTADSVIAVIDTIGDIITLDSQESIETARAAYEILDEEQKAHVTNYDKLLNAEEELKRLTSLNEAKEAAETVIALIDQIGTVNHNSGNAIESAEEAYNALPEGEARQLVSNLPELLEARRVYDNLVSEENRQYIADQAMYYISQIEDTLGADYEITADNIASVKEAAGAARAFYDENITGDLPEASSYVTNYPELLHVEALITIYEWSISGEEFTQEDFTEKVQSITIPVNLESEADIQIAFLMYEALSQEGLLGEDAQDVYENLCSRQQEWEQLQQSYDSIQELERKIIALGTVGANSGEELDAISQLYDSMDDALQAYLKEESVAAWQDAREQYQSILDGMGTVTSVMTEINAIGSVTLDSEETIQAARESYDALSDEEKKQVTNYRTLVEAEYTLLELKKAEEDMPIASVVIERIQSLGTVQLSDEYKVVSARKAYEALTATQKKCVNNLSNLEAAEKRIEALKMATITIEPTGMRVKTGETQTLKAVTSVDNARITWTVSDTTVADFDEKTGGVTGKNAGTVTITGTLENGNQAVCSITVYRAAADSSATGTDAQKDMTNTSSLNQTKAVLYTKGSGKSTKLILTYNGQKVSGKQVKWKSSKTSVVKVTKNGKITAKKKGSAKITATYQGQTFICKVKVKKPSLKLEQKKVVLSLKTAKTYKLKAVANGRSISGKKVKWSSGDKSVAVVSKKGKVNARSKGITQITVWKDGKKATVKIVVKQ